MAYVKISDIQLVQQLDDDAVIEIEQGGKSYSTTIAQILTSRSFEALPDNIWDFSTGPKKKLTLTADTALSISNTIADKSEGLLYVIQDETGGRTLSINGAAMTLNTAANSVTLIGILNIGGTLMTISNAGGGTSSGDATGPVLQTAVVADAAPNKIVLTYNEPINQSAGLTFSDFTVSGGKTPTAISITDSSITVTVDSNYAFGDVITISGGAGKIKDASGNTAANLNNQAVTNNLADAAAAYVAAAGITNQTHIDALTAFVNGLTSNGLWAKTKAFWIMWDTLAQSKFNLVNPVDSDAAFRLTQTGTGTFSAGFTNTTGTSDGLYTKMHPSDANASGLFTRIVSVKTDIAETKGDFGIIGSAPTADFIITRSATNQAWLRGAGSVNLQVANASAIGRYYGVTRAAGSQLYKNGTSLGTSTAYTPADNAVGTFIIGNGGTSGLPSTKKISLAGVMDELTGAEIATLETLISTLETAIGR